MARILIGNVKPVKGVDYFTQEDIEGLGEIFATKEDIGDLEAIQEDIDNLTEDVAELESKIAPATESTEYPGCYYRMVNGVQEWINPPMMPDVEYLTTQRWTGKPVYTKYISTFGTLPDNGEKKLSLNGIIDAGSTVISLDGYAKFGNAHRNMSSIGGEVYITAEWEFVINTTWHANAYTAHIVLKYIKA